MTIQSDLGQWLSHSRYFSHTWEHTSTMITKAEEVPLCDRTADQFHQRTMRQNALARSTTIKELLHVGKVALYYLPITKPHTDSILNWHYLTLLTLLKGWTTGQSPHPSSFTASPSCSRPFILRSVPPHTQTDTQLEDWLTLRGRWSLSSGRGDTHWSVAQHNSWMCAQKKGSSEQIFFILCKRIQNADSIATYSIGTALLHW